MTSVISCVFFSFFQRCIFMQMNAGNRHNLNTNNWDISLTRRFVLSSLYGTCGYVFKIEKKIYRNISCTFMITLQDTYLSEHVQF